jgi:hypothetical protein
MTEPATLKQPRPNGRIGLGLLLIGTGRAAGFAQFGGTVEAYLATLAPWLGLLIVMSGVLAVTGHVRQAIAFFLITTCNLLAPPVIADLFCRWCKREDRWAHYVNVLNCAQWLMLCVIFALLPLASIVLALGGTEQTAADILVALLGIYVVWFNWFAARHALGISGRRAVLVMLGVVFGTAVLLQVPALFAP